MAFFTFGKEDEELDSGVSTLEPGRAERVGRNGLPGTDYYIGHGIERG